MHQHLLNADGVAVQIFDLEVVNRFLGRSRSPRGDCRELVLLEEKHVADLQIARIDPAAGHAGIRRGFGNMLGARPGRKRPAFDHPEGVARGRGDGFTGRFENDEFSFMQRLVTFQNFTQLPRFTGVIERPDAFASANFLNGP